MPNAFPRSRGSVNVLEMSESAAGASSAANTPWTARAPTSMAKLFAAPVDNNSEVFDYDDWVRYGWELKIGWQKATAAALYPRSAPGVEPGRAVGFAARRGANLLFSGAQPSDASNAAKIDSLDTPP